MMDGVKAGFGGALAALRVGERVARVGWNGKDMFLFLVPGSHFKVNRAPLLGIYPEGTGIDYRSHIDMKTAQGDVVPWVASQSDLLAEDWYVVEPVAVSATQPEAPWEPDASSDEAECWMLLRQKITRLLTQGVSIGTGSSAA